MALASMRAESFSMTAASSVTLMICGSVGILFLNSENIRTDWEEQAVPVYPVVFLLIKLGL